MKNQTLTTVLQNNSNNTKDAVEKIKSILKINPNILLQDVEINGEKINNEELNIYSNHDKQGNRIKPFKEEEFELTMQTISKEIVKASENRSVAWKYY